MAGRTVPLIAATVYVFNYWVKSNKWGTSNLRDAREMWAKQRTAWAEEGLTKREVVLREGELMQQMLRTLPVFVMKGLSGAYYSETQLKYALGFQGQVIHLYQLLRDGGGRRKGRGEGGGDWGPRGDRDDLDEFAVPPDAESGEAAPERFLRAIGYSEAVSRTEGGSSSGGQIVARGGPGTVSIVPRMGELCAPDRPPTEFAPIVVRSALSLGLGVQDAMKRAVWQYEAAGREHSELRREFIKILADVISQSDPGDLGAQGRGGVQKESGEPEDEDLDSGEEEEVEEEVEEEDGEDEEEEEEEDDGGSVDLEVEEMEESGPAFFAEKPGRSTTGKAPIPGLGEMGREYWKDFVIPREAVMMVSSR